jgi:hypothetical protein
MAVTPKKWTAEGIQPLPTPHPPVSDRALAAVLAACLAVASFAGGFMIGANDAHNNCDKVVQEP